MAFSKVDNDPNQCIYLEDWINWIKIQLQKVQKIYSIFLTFLQKYISAASVGHSAYSLSDFMSHCSLSREEKMLFCSTY